MAAAGDDEVPPGPFDKDKDDEYRGPKREVHYIVGEDVEIYLEDEKEWVAAVIKQIKTTMRDSANRELKQGYLVRYTESRQVHEVPDAWESQLMRKVRRQDLPVNAGTGPDIAARGNRYLVAAPR